MEELLRRTMEWYSDLGCSAITYLPSVFCIDALSIAQHKFDVRFLCYLLAIPGLPPTS